MWMRRTTPYSIKYVHCLLWKSFLPLHSLSVPQVEILAIDEIGKLTVPHLLGTVKYFLQKMFGPEIDVKYRASYFPFTE